MGLNTKVFYFEGKTIFGYAKEKLDLPSRNYSNSHCYDLVKFFVPRLDKEVSPFQL